MNSCFVLLFCFPPWCHGVVLACGSNGTDAERRTIIALKQKLHARKEEVAKLKAQMKKDTQDLRGFMVTQRKHADEHQSQLVKKVRGPCVCVAAVSAPPHRACSPHTRVCCCVMSPPSFASNTNSKPGSSSVTM